MHNTSEIIDCGTHIRTAPFARAIYDTEATEVVIDSWNDVYAGQASAAEIGVYVDGVYQESVRATAMGAAQHTVTLPEGMKRVEIVTNGYRGPAVVNIPSLIGPSIWLKSLSFNAPATKVPPPTERGVVIIGDSIANGSKLPSAIQEAYPRLLQMENPDLPINVIGRGGLALHDITTGLGTQTNFRPSKLAREVIKYNPQLVIFALGYNDAARNVWNAATYSAAIDALASEIETFLPDARMAAMTMLYTSNPQGNYATIKDSALQVASARGYAAPVLNGADLDIDGVHPNASGHQKIAAMLAPIVGARTVPDTREFNIAVDSYAASSQSPIIFNTTTSGGTSFSVPNSSTTAGPRWHRPESFNPGPLYKFRLTLEAGSAESKDYYTQKTTTPFGAWSNGVSYFYFAGNQTGRVRLDIADIATDTIRATCRIWRGAQYAP